MKKKKVFSLFDLMLFLIVAVIGGGIIFVYGYRDYRDAQEHYQRTKRKYEEVDRQNNVMRAKIRSFREYIRNEMEEDHEFHEYDNFGEIEEPYDFVEDYFTPDFD